MSDAPKSETSEHDARLTALEVKLAYQETTIEQLSEELITQKREIDALTEKLSRLHAQIEQLQTDSDTSEIEEIPPHY